METEDPKVIIDTTCTEVTSTEIVPIAAVKKEALKKHLKKAAKVGGGALLAIGGLVAFAMTRDSDDNDDTNVEE